MKGRVPQQPPPIQPQLARPLPLANHRAARICTMLPHLGQAWI